MKKLILSAAIILAACSSGAPSGGVEISDAYIAPPFKGRDVAAGFLQIENSGPDTRLVSASSPIADRTEIHTHLEEDGIMKMRQIDGVDLPNGASVTFEPGSYHLMMFGVELADGTTEAPLTLIYENGESVTMIVPVERR